MLSSTEEERISEFNRVMKWISGNQKTWDRVILSLDRETDLGNDIYIEIIHQLKEQQFYQLLLVMFHSANYKIGQAVERATFEALFKHADRKSLDDFVQIVKQNLSKMERR